MTTLRIGTRGSPLALWQANHVAGVLRARQPSVAVEIVRIQTTGDQVRDRPLSQIGGDGLFTKEIQQALLNEQVDVAVHSLKDLPTTVINDLVLAAVPARGACGDAFVSRQFKRFDELPRGATLATSSLRRRAQVLHHRPDLKLVDIRGNVETRLRKLAESELAGLILAQAGLERLGLGHAISEVLDPTWMLPAVGQGALGIECRLGDTTTQNLIRILDDSQTHAAVFAERSMLRALGGGCQVPIGAVTAIDADVIRLRGVVVSVDGCQWIEAETNGSLLAAEALGKQVATELLKRGAKALLS